MKRIWKLFSKEDSIRRASVVLIVTLAVSNILGLLRDLFLTKNISTYYLDIYYASFRIPDLIFNVLIFGAITAAFIPVFSGFVTKKEDAEGLRVMNILINYALIFTAVSAVFLIIFMPSVMPLVVPKFDATRLALAVKYSRILMVTPIFFSVSFIIGGMLNCYKRFLAYSLSPLFYNAAIIVGAIFLAPKYGIVGVVWSVIVGVVLYLVVLIPPAYRSGFRYRMILDFSNKSVKHIIRLMIPRTISLSVNQIMLWIYTAIASAMAVGSISAFTLANNIQTVPIIVLGSSFAAAVFPTLSAKIAEDKISEFSALLNKSLRTIGFLLIPSTVILIILRAHVVRLIYGHGKFGWEDTRLTALTLGAFAISILAQGLIPILARAFYALKNTKTPMYISIVTVAVSVLIAFPLSARWGVAGLAVAFTIGSYFNVLALLIALQRQYHGVIDRKLFYSYGKTIFISLIMGLIVWRLIHTLNNYVDMTRFWGIFTQASVAALAGLVVFLILAWFFDSEEMRWAFTRKINGENKEPEGAVLE